MAHIKSHRRICISITEKNDDVLNTILEKNKEYEGNKSKLVDKIIGWLVTEHYGPLIGKPPKLKERGKLTKQAMPLPQPKESVQLSEVF